MTGLDRRGFLRLTGLGAGLFALGASPLLSGCKPGTPAYGFIADEPDANGLRLPAGFTSRIVATVGQVVAGTSYVWHAAPDGGACFDAGDGGWIYVSNSEIDGGNGGVGMLRFAADGTLVDARSICAGTSRNCAGGPTTWGAWLSCEEISRGRVVECDPFGVAAPVAHPAMGLFNHEATAEDPATGDIYLTEDKTDGCLYRFRPVTRGDLSAGSLEVMTDVGGVLGWAPIPDPSANPTSTRYQVASARRFDGGEGLWYDRGSLYFTTKGDNRVWRYELATTTLTVIYDDDAQEQKILTGVDNVTGAPNGDLYIAEDGGDMQLCMIDEDGVVGVFLQLMGRSGSEMTGPAFSPAGNRLYFSSQRSPGETFEITGPFRT